MEAWRGETPSTPAAGTTFLTHLPPRHLHLCLLYPGGMVSKFHLLLDVPQILTLWPA